MSNPTPQGPWYNPQIEGIYEAELVKIKKSKYGKDDSPYYQLVLELPGPDLMVVTNIYMPKGSQKSRSVERIAALCRVVGGTPQELVDAPSSFVGRQLRIKMVKYAKDRTYHDVELFMLWDAVPTSVPS